jgi:succinyl-CoA synthetase beta subunit
MYNALDLIQLEINPWATNPQNQLYCIDGKLNVDDNAKFRQKELVQMKKESLGSEQTDEYEEKVLFITSNFI